MNEDRKLIIIESICGVEKKTIGRAELLLAGSILFLKKEAWEESRICNDEAIILLERLMFKIKENKKFLDFKINNKK